LARIPPHEAYAIRMGGQVEFRAVYYFAGVASEAAGCGAACGVAIGWSGFHP
jgi:hypothetical protein